jgi:hypothetical protein
MVCGSVHYWAAMLGVAAALPFLTLGFRRFSASWVEAVGVVTLGFIAFGLVE